MLCMLFFSCTYKVKVEVKIKDIDKLIDGGFTIHVDGIPDGGVPVSIIYEIPTLQKFLKKDEQEDSNVEK